MFKKTGFQNKVVILCKHDCFILIVQKKNNNTTTNTTTKKNIFKTVIY